MLSLILCSLCRYKHILGWPVTVADLEQLDADTYANLCKLKDLDDVEVSLKTYLCVDLLRLTFIGLLSRFYGD